jgi:hypothetical protein
MLKRRKYPLNARKIKQEICCHDVTHTYHQEPPFWHSSCKVLIKYKNYSKSSQIFTISTIKCIFFFYLFNALHVQCWSASQSKSPALKERGGGEGGSQVSLEIAAMRKNPYLCQEQNPGYQNHNQLLRFVTHMHKCILLNLTSSGYLSFRSTVI